MKSTIMKPLTLFLAVAVCFLFAYLFFFSSSKIGYVDSSKLMNGYNAMIEARKEFDKKQAVWKSNVDTLTYEVQESIKKYEKTAALGTDKEKLMARDLITTKQKQLYDYQNVARQNSSEEEQRLTQNVLVTVNTYLQRYGKKHGYKFILIAANGNIAYADGGLDITDKVVEDLNKEYAVQAKQ